MAGSEGATPITNDDQLLTVLRQHAARYTPDAHAQARLVEQVLQTVPDHVDELLSGAPEKALFQIMHNVAAETSAGQPGEQDDRPS